MRGSSTGESPPMAELVPDLPIHAPGDILSEAPWDIGEIGLVKRPLPEPRDPAKWPPPSSVMPWLLALTRANAQRWKIFSCAACPYASANKVHHRSFPFSYCRTPEMVTQSHREPGRHPLQGEIDSFHHRCCCFLGNKRHSTGNLYLVLQREYTNIVGRIRQGLGLMAGERGERLPLTLLSVLPLATTCMEDLHMMMQKGSLRQSKWGVGDITHMITSRSRSQQAI